MKKYTQLIVELCLIGVVGIMCPAAGFSRALGTEDLKKIQCAQDKMRILAGFFNTDLKESEKSTTLTDLCGAAASKPVTMPDWLAQELARMDKNDLNY